MTKNGDKVVIFSRIRTTAIKVLLLLLSVPIRDYYYGSILLLLPVTTITAIETKQQQNNRRSFLLRRGEKPIIENNNNMSIILSVDDATATEETEKEEVTTTTPTTNCACNTANREKFIKELLLKEANYDYTTSTEKKRSDYLSWDDYFVSVACLSSYRSKDPVAPKGACIVDGSTNRIIGIGYNGFPYGCSDDVLPWKHNSTKSNNISYLHTSSAYECKAEINAILNKCSPDVVGARMYVGQFPCNECAKIIVQSRMKEVIYITDDEPDDDKYRASRIILQMGGVTTRQYKPSIDTVTIDLLPSNSEHSKTITTTPVNKRRKLGDDKESHDRKILFQEAKYDDADSGKRVNYLSWDDYFMSLAFLTAKRSKDPNTQVGACIVDPLTHKVLACGYNGFPRGCSDDHLPWGRTASDDLHKKYHYVCHAEVNAVLNKGSASLQDSTLYVALFPCNECAKIVIQAGIQEVVYLNDHYHDTDACRASRIMFGMAGVKLRRHVPSTQNASLDLIMK